MKKWYIFNLFILYLEQKQQIFYPEQQNHQKYKDLMSYANKGGFQYNFTRESEFEELRQQNYELQRQNHELRSSLQELLQVHEELTLRLEQFESMNHQGQNTGQMQQKIDLLTRELDSLKQYIQEEHYQKQRNSNQRDSQATYEDKQRTEQVVQILQELTKSFESVQTNYQDQIDQLQSDISSLKNQWGTNFKKLQHQYTEKIHTFQDVIIQLKRKDQLVSMIEQKLKNSQDALRAIQEFSVSQRPNQKNTIMSYNDANRMNQNSNEGRQPSINRQEKQKFMVQIEQKNKIIQAYKELILKLRQKMDQKS